VGGGNHRISEKKGPTTKKKLIKTKGKRTQTHTNKIQKFLKRNNAANLGAKRSINGSVLDEDDWAKPKQSKPPDNRGRETQFGQKPQGAFAADQNKIKKTNCRRRQKRLQNVRD